MSKANGSTSSGYVTFRLGDLFDERRESGRAGLPTLSITMDGAFDRDSLDRRVESALLPEQHSLAHKDDLAYNTMRLWQGVISRAPYDCLVSPAYVVVSPNAQIDSMFAEHLFRSEESIRKFRRHSQGVADDRLRCYFDEFARIKVDIPPLPEQKRIAAVLSAVDGAIESNRAVQTQTRRLKQATLQSLLTHGLPGKHKRFRAEKGIGQIPADWELRKLDDLITDVRYGTSAKSESLSGAVAVLRIPNVVSGEVDVTDMKYTDLQAAEVERLRLETGDLLMVRTNGNPDCVGRGSLFRARSGIWAYASYLIRVRPDSTRIVPEFLFHYVMNGPGRDELVGGIRTSAGNYNLNTETICAARIAVPPLPEQRAIVAAISAIDARLSATTAALLALTKLKAALSQELLTGSRL